MRFSYRIAAIMAVSLVFLASCKKNTDNGTGSYTPAANALFETFESGSKTTFPAGSVTLSTGSWTFDDAIIGNTSSDHRNGNQAARITNTGSIFMNFDFTKGTTGVKVRHARYGSDGNSTWELRMSIDGGATYSVVGSPVTTSSTSVQTAYFPISYSGYLRIKIVKTGGGSASLNIDDVEIVPSANPTGGGVTTPPGDDDNMLMGNPSNATIATTNFTNYLMVKTYYALSYNKDRGTPNWVSWHLKQSDVGSTSRQDDFRPDATLPAGWYQVQANSYSGSGFDRGHNCPSGDRTSSVAANSSTFLMTNMIPQAPNLNQQTWGNMETYLRSLVSSGSELYIIMGSYGTGGTGSSGTVNTIDNGNVTVPSRVWKIALVLPNGNNDISRVTTSTRVIAIDAPNQNSANSNWKVYRTSVDAIEAATGYDFFSALPVNIQTAIEAVVDTQ